MTQTGRTEGGLLAWAREVLEDATELRKRLQTLLADLEEVRAFKQGQRHSKARLARMQIGREFPKVIQGEIQLVDKRIALLEEAIAGAGDSAGLEELRFQGDATTLLLCRENIVVAKYKSRLANKAYLADDKHAMPMKQKTRRRWDRVLELISKERVFSPAERQHATIVFYAAMDETQSSCIIGKGESLVHGIDNRKHGRFGQVEHTLLFEESDEMLNRFRSQYRADAQEK